MWKAKKNEEDLSKRQWRHSFESQSMIMNTQTQTVEEV